MSYYSTYRWCAVPACKNTSKKTPDKLWIQVPKCENMRKTWFKVARRDPKQLCAKTRLYFCEDHFDLEHDMENYVQYKIMGSVKRIRLKPNCIPSRFDWNRKHKPAPNESHLVEAKRPRRSIFKYSVQDYILEIDNVKTSSCIEAAFEDLENEDHSMSAIKDERIENENHLKTAIKDEHIGNGQSAPAFKAEHIENEDYLVTAIKDEHAENEDHSMSAIKVEDFEIEDHSMSAIKDKHFENEDYSVTAIKDEHIEIEDHSISTIKFEHIEIEDHSVSPIKDKHIEIEVHSISAMKVEHFENEDKEQEQIENVSKVQNLKRVRQHPKEQIYKSKEHTNVAVTRSTSQPFRQRECKLIKKLPRADYQPEYRSRKKRRATNQQEHRIPKKHKTTLNSGSAEMIPKQAAGPIWYMPPVTTAQLTSSNTDTRPIIQPEPIIEAVELPTVDDVDHSVSDIKFEHIEIKDHFKTDIKYEHIEIEDHLLSASEVEH